MKKLKNYYERIYYELLKFYLYDVNGYYEQFVYLNKTKILKGAKITNISISDFF